MSAADSGGTHRAPGPRAVVLWLVAAALAGATFGGTVLARSGAPGGSGPSRTTSPTATMTIEAESLDSVDPSGGSGFRPQEDGTWRTQTYTTADFGRLKDGVGLVLDLGAPRRVSSVTLPMATAGLTLQLRAGDEPGQDPAGYPVVDQQTSAGGAVAFDAAGGGAHRYWLVWVTRLAPGEGGFAATVGTPRAEGPASGT